MSDHRPEKPGLADKLAIIWCLLVVLGITALYLIGGEAR